MSEQSKSKGQEYERDPIPQKKLRNWRSFLGMYAGEHAAGTEFMIGPLFLASGVSAFDLIIGLIIGNFLAVLSWRYVLVPIATNMRLTLYFHLEKICGVHLVKVYNLANGVLFCFLAGAMVTISATAIGIPFNMSMPALDDVYPSSITWVVVVLVVGSLIAIVAAKGYDTVSRFSNVAAPWMILIFIASGFVAMNDLGVHNFSDLWAVWGEGSAPLPGQTKFTLWHVIFFGWFCNAAMHIGMADLSIFRFAKSNQSGWTTAGGMYIGHFIAWISASLLYALYLQSPPAISLLANGSAPAVSPGPMAYNAIGITGILVVIIAGWTTANPTIYRAGLAFQAIFPKSSRYKVTLLAGGIATVAGLFPAIAMQLLDFVGLYGFILAPIGAIIFFEFYLSKQTGIRRNYAELSGTKFSWPVLLSWGISIGLFYSLSVYQGVFISFFTLPAWLLCGLLFLLFSKFSQNKILQ